MKSLKILTPLLALGLLASSSVSYSKMITPPAEETAKEPEIAQKPSADKTPTKEPVIDAQAQLKQINDLLAVIRPLQLIGGVIGGTILRIMALGNLADGLDLLFNSLIKIASELNKQTPDVEAIIQKIELTQKAQMLILKDADKITRVGATIFAKPLAKIIISDLRRKGEVYKDKADGIEKVKIKKSTVEDVVKIVKKDGKDVEEKTQQIKETDIAVPVSEAPKHVIDIIISQSFKVVRSIQEFANNLIFSILESQKPTTPAKQEKEAPAQAHAEKDAPVAAK